MKTSLRKDIIKLTEGMGLGMGKFKPFAYYDKKMDSIRVQFSDCSFKEEYNNRFLETLKDNHKYDKIIGCNINNVSILFKEIGLPKNSGHFLQKIVDAMTLNYSDSALNRIKQLIADNKRNKLFVEIA